MDRARRLRLKKVIRRQRMLVTGSFSTSKAARRHEREVTTSPPMSIVGGSLA